MWFDGRPTKAETAQGVEKVVVRDNVEFLILTFGCVRLVKDGVPIAVLPGELIHGKRPNEILDLIYQSENALRLLRTKIDALRMLHVNLLGQHSRCSNHFNYLTETKHDCRACSNRIEYGIFYPDYNGQFANGLTWAIRRLMAAIVDDDEMPEELEDECRSLAYQFEHCGKCGRSIGFGVRFCGWCGDAITLPCIRTETDLKFATFVSSWADGGSTTINPLQCLGPPLSRAYTVEYQELPQMLKDWPRIEAAVLEGFGGWSATRAFDNWLRQEWVRQQELRRAQEQEELEQEEDERWVERRVRRKQMLAHRLRRGY
jgi:hypothetical protein